MKRRKFLQECEALNKVRPAALRAASASTTESRLPSRRSLFGMSIRCGSESRGPPELALHLEEPRAAGCGFQFSCALQGVSRLSTRKKRADDSYGIPIMKS